MDEIFIGFSLADQTQYNTVLEAAIAFYRESLRYVLDKMDISCSFWQQAVWIGIFNKGSAKWSHVKYFLNTLSNVLLNDDEKIDRSYEEFTDYKTLWILELPDTALTDALIASYEDHVECCLDTMWYHLYQMKSLIENDYRFCKLFSVAHLVLATPHSNAGIEYLYSLFNKNKKEGNDRNNLVIEGSLSVILTVKMDQPESFSKCYDFKPSQ